MQNRYFGDIGDYGKYSFLRMLCGQSDHHQDLSLQLVWYLFPDEGHNDDGKHTSYLDKEHYRAADPVLFDALKASVSAGRRRVSEIEQTALLGSRTGFFNDVLDYSRVGTTGKARKAAVLRHREAWLRRALEQCREQCREQPRGADLVFLDPDNGFEVKSVPRHAPKAPKYVFWQEARRFFDAGSSLIIYHHLNRTMTSAQQVETIRTRITEKIEPQGVYPLLFRRGSHRVFFVISQARHDHQLRTRSQRFATGAWAEHSDLF